MTDAPAVVVVHPGRVDQDAHSGDVDLAAIGALLADPGRCQVLLALGDGRALPASRLAAEAGVSPSTASSHLAKLTAGGLLSVERHGRHRFYRLSGASVGHLIESLAQLAPAQTVRSLRQGTRAQALRSARSCYDHLAGRLGVEIMASLLERGCLQGGDGTFDPARAAGDHLNAHGRDVDYRFTSAGLKLMSDIGVPRSGRPAVRYCIDWSEQRHHLSGAVGRHLLARLVELDWVRRSPTSRAVSVTNRGRDSLASRFGVEWPATI